MPDIDYQQIRNAAFIAHHNYILSKDENEHTYTDKDDEIWWIVQEAVEHCKKGEPVVYQWYEEDTGFGWVNITKEAYYQAVMIGNCQTRALFTHAMPKSDGKVISNDDKLPVDVRIAGGTVGKGCKFETLLIRINAFNKFYDENLVDKDAQRKARENLLALITPQPSTDISELVSALNKCIYAMEYTLIQDGQAERVYTDYAEALRNAIPIIAKHTVK